MTARTTIITTFRDAARYLPAAIRSLKQQRQSAFTSLLFDDGSRDQWREEVEPLIAGDPRFRLVPHDPVGRRAALKRAHALAQTEFVAWLDADDKLHPDALAKTESFLDENADVGMVFTDNRRIDARGNLLRRRHRPAWSRPGQLVDFSTFHFRLIRRAAFSAAGGISDLEIGIDYDLALRLAEVTRFGHLAEPLYFYRVHGAQMSSRKRGAQRQASAQAVRRALKRRAIPATTLQLRRNRFVLRVRSNPETSAISRPLRRTAVAVRPTTATVWPAENGDFVATALRDGLHRQGVALTATGTTIQALTRRVQQSKVGDVLLLHSVGAMLGEHPTRSLVELGACITRLRLRGTRVVWCRWADRVHPRPHGLVVRALSAMVDAVVDCGDSDDSPLGRLCAVGSPDVSEFVPHITQSYARTRLGLEAREPVVLCLASSPDDRVLLRRAQARLGGDGAHFLLTGAHERHRAATCVPHPSSAREVSMLVAASDVVALGGVANARAFCSLAIVAKRPVFSMPSLGTSSAELPAFSLELDVERLADVASRMSAPRVCPAKWAEMLLETC